MDRSSKSPQGSRGISLHRAGRAMARKSSNTKPPYKPFAERFNPELVSGYLSLTVMHNVEPVPDPLAEAIPWQAGTSPPARTRYTRITLSAAAGAELLTIEEVSRLTKLSEKSVRIMAQNGALPKPRIIGRSVRWLATELLEWLQPPSEE